MNTENSKTNEPHKFKLFLSDKRNLKNPNKNIALGNLLQLGTILLICLMLLILLKTFKTALNLSSKNMEL